MSRVLRIGAKASCFLPLIFWHSLFLSPGPRLQAANTQVPNLPPTDAPKAQDVPPPAPGQTPPILPKTATVPSPVPLSIPAPTSDQQPQSLDAESAAQLALRVQPTLRLAEAELLSAQGRYQIVRAGLLPKLTLGTTYGRAIEVLDGTISFPAVNSSQSGLSGTGSAPTAGGSGTFAGLTNTLTVSQLIFDFNHTLSQVRQASALEAAAHQGLSLAQLNLTYAVKQAFYTYVQDQALLKVQQSDLSNAQAQLALAMARLQVGLGPPSDVVTAIEQTGTSSVNVVSADQAAVLARINLALAIGVDPRTPIVTSTAEEAPPPGTDMNAWVTQAIAARPDVKQALANIRAAGYELSAARTTSAPSINLLVSGIARGGDDPLSQTGGTLGLSMNWTLIDSGVTAGTVKEARADAQIAKANLQIATQTVVSDVATAFTSLQAARQKVPMAEANVANAQLGVNLAEGRYRAGVALFIEVTTAEANYVTAETDLVNAQAAVQLAVAQLRHAMGML